jgi:hypothetical protein
VIHNAGRVAFTNHGHSITRLSIVRSHFDERQVTADVRLVGNEIHLDDVDQLIQVGRNAPRISPCSVYHDGHARDMRAVCAPYREAIHVEVAAPEKTRHTVEDTWLVLN